jgi:hypothetical protein
VFYWVGAYYQRWAQYDPDGDNGNGLWTEYDLFNVEIDMVAAVDPVRDLLVLVDGRGTHQVFVANLTDPAAGFLTVSVVNGATPLAGGGHGFEWCPPLEKFVMWIEGASVWTLTPPAGDWGAENWIWEEVAPAAGNAVSPDAPNMNRTYSRWRWAPAISCFVVVNRTSGAVYAYRPFGT